jgi:hypothetical protein
MKKRWNGIFEDLEENKKVNLLDLNKIKLPPNLSIFGYYEYI